MLSNFSARVFSRSFSPVCLGRRNVYILPTRYGFLLGIILVMILLGAMQYNNSMGFLLAFTLMSMGFVGLFYTYYNLVGLTVAPASGQAVFAGERGAIPLWFDNRGLPARFAIQIQFFQGVVWRPRWRDWLTLSLSNASLITVDLQADQVQRLDLPILTDKRGVVNLGKITLSTTFPFGLWRAWTFLEWQQAQLLVYPRPQGVLPFPQGTAQEGLSAHLHGDGEDFNGFRPYVLGDLPHHIDWKAAARERGLLIKQFTGNDGAQRYFFSFQDVAMLGNVELALSQLCDWIVQAHRQGLHYGLILPTHTFPPSNDDTHYHNCLSALANFQS